MRERKRTSCRVSLWGHDSRNTRIPSSWNFSLVPDYKNILQCHVFLEIRSNILSPIGYSVGNSTHVEFSKIVSNILYAIEYSYGPTEVPTIYLTFSIAYLIYSTSQYVYMYDVITCTTKIIPGTRATKAWCALGPSAVSSKSCRAVLRSSNYLSFGDVSWI